MTSIKIISWNVNGFRAVVKKGFYNWLKKENPDILCVQETKAQSEQLPTQLLDMHTYIINWNSAERKGYSGVGTFTKIKPESVKIDFGIPKISPEYNNEGRLIASEYDKFVLLNTYMPNGKKDDGRLKYKLKFYDLCFDFMENLRKDGKEVILTGDINTAHNEIDLANPKANSKYSGFLRSERDWMDKLVNAGYVDTYRHFNPDEEGAYTWWSARAKEARTNNVGWRLDYFFVSERLLSNIEKAFILKEVIGSDHCPIGIILKF